MHKRYYEKHKERILAHNRKYRAENKERINKKKRDKYWEDTRDIRGRNAVFYIEHHEERMRRNKQYRDLHKDELNEKKRIRFKIKKTFSLGYDIRSLKNINDGLVIHLNNDGLGNYSDIYGDFCEHFRKVLFEEGVGYWGMRFSLTGFNSGVLIHFSPLNESADRKKLRGFLSFYKRLLEREIEK